jgi:CheY-like chemotaxis protein
VLRIHLLDDIAFPWQGVEAATQPHILAKDLDTWFWEWARQCKVSRAFEGDGLFLIHANGRFSVDAHRQDLQGLDILKHIRLTPWLRKASTWHAVVYSFEPLKDILSRKPGALILTSPGVTFLHLPEALALQTALTNAYREGRWEASGLNEVLSDLAENVRADTALRALRPYVACDYTPPDSAHSISNLWGIYEMFLAFSTIEAPEYSKPELLPAGILEFVLRLDTKEARFLDCSEPAADVREEYRRDFRSTCSNLIERAKGRTIAYVDDEADKGWLTLLLSLVNDDSANASCRVITPDPSQLVLADKIRKPDEYNKQVADLAEWVKLTDASLLVLDLRLLGSRESDVDPNEASGMDLARAVRALNPHLPILLFTASNKAQTLLVSQSLEVDDYWMKPGIGEHAALRSREENLIALARKLSALLGEDYAWLQRVGYGAGAIGERRNNPWWWEQTVSWPGPSEDNPGNRRDVQPARPSARKEVLNYVQSILHTARILFKRQTAAAMVRGARNQGRRDPISERLCASLFNQVGQVVEMLHAVSDSETDPFKNAKDGNARIGGYYSKAKQAFVFRRCDWWAFHLFALRNKFSHHGEIPTLQDAKSAVSELFAWLMCVRVKRQVITPETRSAIADRMLNSPLWQDGEPYPVLCLVKEEKKAKLDIGGRSIYCKTPDGHLAQDDRFLQQLLMRREFNDLARKSEELLDGRKMA